MARNHASVLLLVVALAASACDRNSEHRAEFFVFGTLVEVRLVETDPRTAARVFGQLQQAFQRMHQEWHAWEPGALVRLNQALQAGHSAATTPEIIQLIRHAQLFERTSGGRFNPAIGRLVGLWGFHTSDFPIHGSPPHRDEIRLLVRSEPSTLDLRIEGDRVFTANPDVQLDFGGIAKGFAVDLAVGFIREAGIDSAIVNAGGDLRTLGSNHGKNWRIGVQDPSGGVAGGISVQGDLAVFTSGNYARFRQDNQERYPHILDPRTGWPVDSLTSVTVIANDGVTADAAATALVVAGVEEWQSVANEMGIDAAMVIDEAGVIHATASMLVFFSPSAGREIIEVNGQ